MCSKLLESILPRRKRHAFHLCSKLANWQYSRMQRIGIQGAALPLQDASSAIFFAHLYCQMRRCQYSQPYTFRCYVRFRLLYVSVRLVCSGRPAESGFRIFDSLLTMD